MIEIFGNMWDSASGFDAICVTTNAIVKNNGELVMGKGVAKQFRDRYRGLAHELGQLVYSIGSSVHLVRMQGTNIVSFPTKYHYEHSSNLELIETSAKELVELTERMKWDKVLLPRPGCSNGGKSWKTVKKVIGPLLDDRFYVISDN